MTNKIDALIGRIDKWKSTTYSSDITEWNDANNLLDDCFSQLQTCKGALKNTIACLEPLKEAGQLEDYDLFLIDNALVNSRKALSTNEKEDV